MSHSWSEWTTLQNKKVNWGLRYQLQAMFKILAHPQNGGEQEPMTILQGCGQNTVAVSGGTHGGTGAEDNTPYNWRNRERVGRILGLFLSLRPEIPGVWKTHMHGVTDGDGGVSASAAAQIRAYHVGRNGLANDGIDRGYHMLVFPLFVFPEKPVGRPGRCWVIKGGKTYEQPTVVSPVKRTLEVGSTFDVVAVVNVGGSYWGVDASASCFPMAQLSRTAPDADGDLVPAKVIDLTNSKVTLPTGKDGKPTEILRPQLDTYKDDHFKVTPDGRGVIFDAPCDGYHTENSYYTRCETREMKNGGKDKAAWNSGQGIHNFRGNFLVEELPEHKPDIVVAQIHDTDDDVIMARVEGSKFFVERDGDDIFRLDSDFKLNQECELSISASTIGIFVSYHNLVTGKRAEKLVLNSRFDDCYYKYGCYTNASSHVSSTSDKYGTGRGRVVWYHPKISHS